MSDPNQPGGPIEPDSTPPGAPEPWLSQPVPSHPSPYAPASEPAPNYPMFTKNGLGTASLVLGIIGVLLGLMPFLFPISALLGVLALTFGLIGRHRVKLGTATNNRAPLAGWILGSIAIFLSLIGVAVVVSLVNDSREAMQDIKISGCEINDSGAMSAVLKVTNHASFDADYAITVSFNNGHGTQLDSTTVEIEALKPDQDANVTADSDQPPQGDRFGCEVVDVNRTRS